jgi:Restriction endonuclease NotI
MPKKILELFGYAPADDSSEAALARNQQTCPVIGGACTKEIGSASNRIRSGVCTIADKTGGPVIICPIRLYADNYSLLATVAKIAFKVDAIQLVDGRKIAAHTPSNTNTLVAVFGKGWGGELKVPGRPAMGRKTSGFFVDWILARLDSNKKLMEFAALEVQTMDTIGSYRNEREAVLKGVNYEGKSAAPNWENVNKRILPQLIYKGHLLEREALCQSGLFFACPEAVYKRIMDRLGSELPEYPLKNNALTFIPCKLNDHITNGKLRKLSTTTPKTTTVQQVQIAFSSPTNLPEAGAYEKAIRIALGELSRTGKR